ncbi:MAG: SAM-dependent methyltransferase [Verrucomicrobia bacterium RIFCSPLOWO2_12_FULL_64_8]|nr:MAG: SAM-dependent methyltransferase [Verrucomicrobia bacterium RIFCSPLOWO2_12_FULL_64_8]
MSVPPFQDHFSGVAGNYAQFRPRYPAQLFDFLRSAAPRAGRVWDCACGSGQATRDLAERFAAVTATDASVGQIAAATPHPRVTYRVAPAETSGLPDHSFDLVTVAQALHWFDLDRFYAEVRRVLAPDGVLAAWSYGFHQLGDEAIDRAARDFYENVVGPYWPPERKLIEQGYRTIPFPFAELAAPRFTMRTSWALPQMLGYLRSWSATARYSAARGHDPIVEFEQKLLPRWGGPAIEREINWPLALRLGRVP